LTAFTTLRNPSALMADDGRMEPTTTTGFVVFKVKFKK
jgi:hypothetical protein